MIPTIDTIIDDILVREGSKYTNHPADKGGPTKYGITLKVLKEYRARPTTVEGVQNLTEEEARAIYWSNYVNRPQFYRIKDPYVLSLAVDSGVNHGTNRVTKWLQRLVMVEEDGVFGEITAAGVNAYNPTKLYYMLLARRLEFYGEIIAHDSKVKEAKRLGIRLQAENALGWMRRAAEFLEV